MIFIYIEKLVTLKMYIKHINKIIPLPEHVKNSEIFLAIHNNTTSINDKITGV